MSMPAVAAVVEAQDLLPGDDAVLDDPVQRAADQLVHPLRPHAGRHAHHAPADPPGDAVLQRLEAGAADGDLGQMKVRHGLK